MKLTITKEAQEKMTALCQDGDYLVLDFEDGQGPFVESGASCQLYPNYRLLFVPEKFSASELTIYDDQLETEAGLVYMKKSSEMFLDDQVILKVENAYQRLQLQSNSGVLVANLPMKRIELDEEGRYNGQTSRSNGPAC